MRLDHVQKSSRVAMSVIRGFTSSPATLVGLAQFDALILLSVVMRESMFFYAPSVALAWLSIAWVVGVVTPIGRKAILYTSPLLVVLPSGVAILDAFYTIDMALISWDSQSYEVYFIWAAMTGLVGALAPAERSPWVYSVVVALPLMAFASYTSLVAAFWLSSFLVGGLGPLALVVILLAGTAVLRPRLLHMTIVGTAFGISIAYVLLVAETAPEYIVVWRRFSRLSHLRLLGRV